MQTITVLIIALLANSYSSKAAEEQDSTGRKEKSVYIGYLGTDAGNLWFIVKYPNPGGGRFSLVIKSSEGDLLFKGAFAGEGFTRKVKLMFDDKNISPTFIIKGSEQLITQSFLVNSAAHLNNQVVVTKL